uniref:Putative secreted peptide n=1 Tax=Anopheles braziliensis TaxID=58242 RepID=A0A2M3ZSI3_9DIPT
MMMLVLLIRAVVVVAVRLLVLPLLLLLQLLLNPVPLLLLFAPELFEFFVAFVAEFNGITVPTFVEPIGPLTEVVIRDS